VLISLLSTQAQTTITVDPNKPRRNFEGWGMSLCWWAHGVGRWSAANYGHVVDLLTDSVTGLGYNIFRYNIGGGDQPGHAHMRQYGDIPGYKPTEAGAYDWTADPYQRNIVASIVAKGKPVIWEAFSNSPPWWMTISGCAAGNTGGADNLKPTYFNAFADYLTEVVRHFRDNWGISFRTLEPFNEPSAGWWTINNNQEGCGFVNNQNGMVKILGRSLQSKGLTATTIAAADENSIADAVTGIGKYDDTALSFTSQMNVHSYNGKNSRAAYATVGAQKAKRLWQSESGPLSWPGGNQMDVSLWMADVIIRDIKEMKVNAWLDWQVLDGGVWGSITPNYTQQTVVPNKRFYMHAGFSRFIRPGAQIIDSDRDSTMAVWVPSTGNLVLVILNSQTTNRNYVVDLSRFNSVPATATAYRTSTNEDLVQQPDVAIQNQKLTVIAMARSINTYVVKVAAPASIIVQKKNRPNSMQPWMRLHQPGLVVFPFGNDARDLRGKAIPILISARK
jgi:O-glycosyl hydrolase